MYFWAAVELYQVFMPLIPSLRNQTQVDFWIQDQPHLQDDIQDSLGYTEKLSQNKTKQIKKTNK